MLNYKTMYASEVLMRLLYTRTSAEATLHDIIHARTSAANAGRVHRFGLVSVCDLRLQDTHVTSEIKYK